MTVTMPDGGGYTPLPLPPPPPPTPETLRQADPSTADRSIAQMTPQQEAQLRSDVQTMPVAERDNLINDLAAKLGPEQLVRIESVFGREVVREAVQTRSSATVRE